jgi:hypothetical protein
MLHLVSLDQESLKIDIAHVRLQTSLQELRTTGSIIAAHQHWALILPRSTTTVRTHEYMLSSQCFLLGMFATGHASPRQRHADPFISDHPSLETTRDQVFAAASYSSQ